MKLKWSWTCRNSVVVSALSCLSTTTAMMNDAIESKVLMSFDGDFQSGFDGISNLRMLSQMTLVSFKNFLKMVEDSKQWMVSLLSNDYRFDSCFEVALAWLLGALNCLKLRSEFGSSEEQLFLVHLRKADALRWLSTTDDQRWIAAEWSIACF